MTEIEFRRQQRGLSQYELASLIGRSQGQLANALRSHDPIAKVSTGCLLWRVRLSIRKREWELRAVPVVAAPGFRSPPPGRITDAI